MISPDDIMLFKDPVITTGEHNELTGYKYSGIHELEACVQIDKQMYDTFEDRSIAEDEIYKAIKAKLIKNVYGDLVDAIVEIEEIVNNYELDSHDYITLQNIFGHIYSSLDI